MGMKPHLDQTPLMENILGIWKGIYANEIDRTRGRGRAPPVVSIKLEYIPSQSPYIFSFNGVESKWGVIPILIKPRSIKPH